MTFAIQAEQLGKSYLIGHRRREPYQTLRESLTQGVRSAWNRLRHPNLSAGGDDIEEFWALRDVSFEIQPGDRVGIIGRNGAGKSTLLKILSRITEPTTGRFVTRGRVASLLEVGTGFHPELSGRENIYLNGAILGMTRNDVKRQFDAIVDFAGVEKFLDTPVKRYSSGMYVRLAFAVAAHLEPDILIVDEVLAVGDAEFQKKCLGKMEEVGKEGRTVVFVSHNMGAIRRLCDKGMVVSRGKILHFGDIDLCVNQYMLQSVNNNAHTFKRQQSNTLLNAAIESIIIRSAGRQTEIYSGSPLEVEFVCDTRKCTSKTIKLVLGFYDENGLAVLRLESDSIPISQDKPSTQAQFRIAQIPINAGSIRINAALFESETLTDHIDTAITLQIHQKPKETGKNFPRSMSLLSVDYTCEIIN